MIIYVLSLSKCGKDIVILVFRYVFISVVERAAVNRVVVGSSPTRGVTVVTVKNPVNTPFAGFFLFPKSKCKQVAVNRKI